MRIEVNRVLPDGSIRIVMPFHICLKGLEKAILCRDEEDYDMFVKIICLSARAKNVIVVIYIVLSNHFHLSVLAASEEDADACGQEIKRRYSMWINHKYGDEGILRRSKITAQMMTDRWHIRNALAYIPRNALDNGHNVNTYNWSGYRGMFCLSAPQGLRPVSSLTRRESRAVFHSADRLDGVKWMLNEKNELDPFSICDHAYLEQAFENDQAFFLKTIGALNVAEVRYDLEEKPFNMVSDSVFYNEVNELSMKWFGRSTDNLTVERKYRLLTFCYRSFKTSVSQLARVFRLDREKVRAILGV